jgi:hypothetical protein
VDGLGYLRFEDPVEPGARYTYALQDDGGARIATLEFTAPRGPRLALEGFSPNPGRDRAVLRFSLAGRSPATLTLFDVQGRPVWTRQVAGLGPGEHAVVVEPALNPGVYLARLEQGGEQLTRRCVLLR